MQKLSCKGFPSKVFLISLVAFSLFFQIFTQDVSAEEELKPSKDGVSAELSLLPSINKVIEDYVFFDIFGGSLKVKSTSSDGQIILDETGEPKLKTVALPFPVAFLVLGSILFTFIYGFINIRGFRHSLKVVRGDFDKDGDAGEISHFKALTSALSATIGLGNIAGVAVAVQKGGPGAIPWMVLIAFFGMSAKFHSCTLAQLYRDVDTDGKVRGGPMYYLDIGLKSLGKGWGIIGVIFGVLYSIIVMLGSFGGGNMFQSNQTVEAITSTFFNFENADVVIGIVMAIAVGVVIIGGIKRIADATSKIVPLMCGIYTFAALTVIIVNYQNIPAAFIKMFTMAFTDNAFYGGLVGVFVVGITRAAFSNEAGLGSAAIAHAAAKTSEPVREGLVAMLGPFIDTIIVCTITGLMIVVTGVWQADSSIINAGHNVGVTLTSKSFATVLPWFPAILTISVTLFAYSTMISWCYYGETGWGYIAGLFGDRKGKSLFIFRIFFIFCVYLGAVSPLEEVIKFSDYSILMLAFVNVTGSIFLVPKVVELLKKYRAEYLKG